MGHRGVVSAALSVVVVSGIVTGCAASPTSAPDLGQRSAAVAVKPSGVDLGGLDRGVSPSGSLYEFANGTWARNTDMPVGRDEVSTFTDLADRAQDAQRALLEQARDHPSDDISRQVGDFYASCMDIARRDQLRIAPLGPDLAAVERLANAGDVLRYLGTMQRSDLSDPVSIEVRADPGNPAENIAMASQGRLTLPGRDYYLGQDPQDEATRNNYRAYVAKMLSKAAIPDPQAGADFVLDLETRLARAQGTDPSANVDPDYTKLSIKDAKVRTGLDFKAYFAAFGMDDVHQVLIPHLGYFFGLARLLR